MQDVKLDSKLEEGTTGNHLAPVITGETPAKGDFAPEYYEQPWYKRPIVQVILVSFVCFMCPGTFSVVKITWTGFSVLTSCRTQACSTHSSKALI